MPRGPRGEKRPGDVIGAAVMVARIASGEVEDTRTKPTGRAKGGKVGGRKRAETLPPEERKEIAKRGAAARWRGK